MCDVGSAGRARTAVARAAVVTSSMASAAGLAATGMPASQALLLVGGAGVSGAVSVRLSEGKPLREVAKSFLNSVG